MRNLHYMMMEMLETNWFQRFDPCLEPKSFVSKLEPLTLVKRFFRLTEPEDTYFVQTAEDVHLVQGVDNSKWTKLNMRQVAPIAMQSMCEDVWFVEAEGEHESNDVIRYEFENERWNRQVIH